MSDQRTIADDGAPEPGGSPGMCPEGRDGVEPSYRETLWPGPLMWVLTISGVAALSVAYARALGALAGWVLAGGGLAVATALLAATSPRVRVDSCVLRAGRARLPLRCIGRVLVLDQAAVAVARGPGGDPSAYLVTRAGVRGAVLVEVSDPEDPHRTWLVASRRPGDLAGALSLARGKVCP